MDDDETDLLTLEEAAALLDVDKHELYRLRRLWTGEVGEGIHDLLRDSSERAAPGEPRITRSSVVGLGRKPRKPSPKWEQISGRLASIEAILNRRQNAEAAVVPLLKAEVENLREELKRERTERFQAERISVALAQRLLDFGVDVQEMRDAESADQSTLATYSAVLTELIIPDTP